MQSKPLAATTLRGNVAVTSGSINATVGINRREMIPVLALISVRLKIAMPVVSEPVPEVVGHAICGLSAPGTLWPPPIGAFTYVMKSAGCVAYRLAALQVSITEPPPTETYPSNLPSAANRAAAWNEAVVGSTTTSS